MQPLLLATLQSPSHRPAPLLGKTAAFDKAANDKLGSYKARLETVKYTTNVIMKISVCFIVAGGKELENCMLPLNFQTLIKVHLVLQSRQWCLKAIY